MRDMSLLENFRHNLLAAIEREQISGQELARRSGLHFVTISRILSGKIAPSVENCEKLAKAAGIRPDTAFLAPVEKIAG